MVNKMTTAGASFGMPAKFGAGIKRVTQVSPQQRGSKAPALSKTATQVNTGMNKKPRAAKGMMK